ncbi:hypothetical protein WISP_35509 [Willisornis vidua]|uniref:Uncharacterized protein n=1 Tax=Willisornis vidua TaxID=1566151 RepID=A0ABQ9DPN2_9PASS|nr:hypothetical protein WISP_35509 [Willisornis vidua]
MVSALLHHLDTQVYGAELDPPKGTEVAGKELTDPLSILYQQSCPTREVPDDQRSASMMPIYKKGWKEDLGNYRPDSLTSVLGKVMEQILLSAIIWYMQDNQGTRPHSILEKLGAHGLDGCTFHWVNNLAGRPSPECSGGWSYIQLVTGHQWGSQGISIEDNPV